MLTGRVVAEIGNWNGKVLAAPRGRLGELLKRSEASRTGIYVLTGPDPEQLGGTTAYIGEADVMRLTCDCAFSVFGKVTVSTPFLKRASTPSSLTSQPTGMWCSKRP
jgi:hypothetical protein